MANDAEIGSKLSDNESITVRLPTAAAGIQQGGKWGRSKRPKTTPPAATSAPTRASSRPTKPPPSSAAAGATDAGGGDDGSKSRKKPNGKGKKSAGSASSNGTTGGRVGGVHTLGGPLTPPAASRRGGASGRGRSGQASGRGGGSSPGQVRTMFGSSASTSGRAGGGSNIAAAAAAARRAGGAAAPGGPSQSPPPSSGSVGGEPDAVAAAVAAAGGEAGTSGPSNRKRPRAGTGVQLKSEGDIAERLLTAVAGGGKGTADRFFRKAMKLAVDKQWDQSRAGEISTRSNATVGKALSALHHDLAHRTCVAFLQRRRLISIYALNLPSPPFFVPTDDCLFRCNTPQTSRRPRARCPGRVVHGRGQRDAAEAGRRRVRRAQHILLEGRRGQKPADGEERVVQALVSLARSQMCKTGTLMDACLRGCFLGVGGGGGGRNFSPSGTSGLNMYHGPAWWLYCGLCPVWH